MNNYPNQRRRFLFYLGILESQVLMFLHTHTHRKSKTWVSLNTTSSSHTCSIVVVFFVFFIDNIVLFLLCGCFLQILYLTYWSSLNDLVMTSRVTLSTLLTCEEKNKNISDHTCCPRHHRFTNESPLGRFLTITTKISQTQKDFSLSYNLKMIDDSWVCLSFNVSLTSNVSNPNWYWLIYYGHSPSWRWRISTWLMMSLNVILTN